MWEYKVVADGWAFKTTEEAQAETREAMQKLNMEGAQGWELTSVQYIPIAQREAAFIYFYRRPKR